jgi:hypothetical protein
MLYSMLSANTRGSCATSAAAAAAVKTDTPQLLLLLLLLSLIYTPQMLYCT